MKLDRAGKGREQVEAADEVNDVAQRVARWLPARMATVYVPVVAGRCRTLRDNRAIKNNVPVVVWQ